MQGEGGRESERGRKGEGGRGRVRGRKGDGEREGSVI